MSEASLAERVEEGLQSSAWVARLTDPSNAKYFVLGASGFVFARAYHRARQQAKGKLDVPLTALLESPQWRAANPKAAAYLFSGRAFTTATFLVGTGAILLTSTIASVMGVNSLPEFSERMRSLSLAAFPGLRRTGDRQTQLDERLDAEAQEFVDQVSGLLEQDAKTYDQGWAPESLHGQAQQKLKSMGF